MMIETIYILVICVDLLNKNIQHASSHYPHLAGLKLGDTSRNLNKQIEILIGSDYYYSFIFGEVLKDDVNGPVAINSLFGRILFGRFDSPTSDNLNSVHILRIHTETMSENIFNDKLDSCAENLFPCYQESDKLENNKAYIDFKDNPRLKTVATQQNCHSKSFTTSYLTTVNQLRKDSIT